MKENINTVEMLNKIDEVAFFLGCEGREDNAVLNASCINTLLVLKGHLQGEKGDADKLREEIVAMVYYLGGEMNAANVTFVSECIQTLHEAMNKL